MTCPLDRRPTGTSLELAGCEPDNLLSFLTLMGLLHALETAQEAWRPRLSWDGPPWVPHLHLDTVVTRSGVAAAANEGVRVLVQHFDADDRKNVDFNRDEYRGYARRMRDNAVSAALAAALTAEWPTKKDGGLTAAPLVMMFGQGWQNFLERLIEVPSGKLPNRLRKLKSPPDMGSTEKIAEALFEPWQREDDADGFRWDPEDDQRYALRFGDPSAAGAAPTVAGANRLAAIGFISFPAVPGERRLAAVGALRDNLGWSFLWPIWSQPLSRAGIEALLTHPQLYRGDRESMRPLGVHEIFRARRIANGKFMNVTRARPMEARSHSASAA